MPRAYDATLRGGLGRAKDSLNLRSAYTDIGGMRPTTRHALTTAAVLLCAVAGTACRPDWAQYRIEAGQHVASVHAAANGDLPRSGFSTTTGRFYTFVLDASAAYQLTNPTQPDDQFDWNKLPGLSDCGDIDLSRNGAMFAWRWRSDLDPQRLEVTAYANANGVHQTPDEPLFTLTADELAAEPEITYLFGLDGDQYRFAATGTVGDRRIDATANLPRSCPGVAASTLKWASGLYFGGTSTAPQVVTGWIREP